jgi:hypothetical protein
VKSRQSSAARVVGGCLASLVLVPFAWAAKADGQAKPTCFYVSKAGSNADGKSWATAWNELDRIDWGRVQAGDTVLLDGGVTKMVYTTTLTVGASGTEAAPILIRRATEAGHDGQVVIFGGRSTALVCGHAARYTYQTEGVRKYGVDLGAHSYVTLDGGKWRGIAIYGHNLHGVHLSRGSSRDIVRNVEIYDNGQAVFDSTRKWWNPDQPGVGLTGAGHVFERDIIHDNGQDAFQCGGGLSDLTIRNCWLYNGRSHPRSAALAANYTMHSDGIQVYNGGVQSGVLIEGCIIGPGMMQGTILGQTPTHGVAAQVDDVTIRDTLFLDATNANIMGYPQIKSRHWTIDHVTAFMTRTNPDGKERTNLFLEGTGHKITNSIFYGSALYLPGEVSTEANIQFHTSGRSIGATVDPQFVNVPTYDSHPDLATLIRSDFALKPGSPAQGKGSSITSVVRLLGDAGLIPLPPPDDPKTSFLAEAPER